MGETKIRGGSTGRTRLGGPASSPPAEYSINLLRDVLRLAVVLSSAVIYLTMNDPKGGSDSKGEARILENQDDEPIYSDAERGEPRDGPERGDDDMESQPHSDNESPRNSDSDNRGNESQDSDDEEEEQSLARKRGKNLQGAKAERLRNEAAAFGFLATDSGRKRRASAKLDPSVDSSVPQHLHQPKPEPMAQPKQKRARVSLPVDIPLVRRCDPPV
jgi:hypothetical protein